jgi:hypothetical protein
MSAYDPHAWVEFGVALAGAAAVLTGLVFISVSVNLEKVLKVHGLPGRAGESIVMFTAVLVLSIFLLMPGQSSDALGIELIAGGILKLVVLLIVAIPGLNQPTRQPLTWRISRIFAAVVTSVPIAISGASLIAGAGGGLYWLAGAFALAFSVGIANAWVLLVEVVRDERYRPAESGEDID